MTEPVVERSVVERLQMARFELEAGRTELADVRPTGAYKAVKSFHDALETFLIAVASHLGVPSGYRHFHEYPKLLEKHGKHPFKHPKVIRQLNDLRNQAKHDAIYPQTETVKQLSAQLDPVFEDNARIYLGVSFLGVSLATTISDSQTRKDVAAAEESLVAKDYESALGSLRLAFDTFLLRNRVNLKLPDQLINQELLQQAKRYSPDLRSRLEDINVTWALLVKRFTLLNLGINLANHELFLAITPAVFIPHDPTFRKVQQRPDARLFATREHVAFALGFVVDSVRRIEAIPGAPASHDPHRIRFLKKTPCLCWKGDRLEATGEAEVGEEIAVAHFGLGPDGEVWIFERNGQRVMVPFDSCEDLDVAK